MYTTTISYICVQIGVSLDPLRAAVSFRREIAWEIEFDVGTSVLRVKKNSQDGRYCSSSRRVGGHWVEITAWCEDNPQNTRFSALAWEAVIPPRPQELPAAQIKIPRNSLFPQR